MIVKLVGEHQPRNFPRRNFSSVYRFPPNSETFASIQTVLYDQSAHAYENEGFLKNKFGTEKAP